MLESFRIITNNPAVVEKNYAENEHYDVDVLKLFQMEQIINICMMPIQR